MYTHPPPLFCPHFLGDLEGGGAHIADKQQSAARPGSLGGEILEEPSTLF